MKYISKPVCIMLAVTGANTDLANSDGLKMAREVDPDGTRTIGVLTKVDLMYAYSSIVCPTLIATGSRDTGTDVVDILAGRIIPLRLGYVPVVNCSQRDIEANKAISSAFEHERQFFENHPSYKGKSKYCGTPFLAYKLNMVKTTASFTLLRLLMNTQSDSYAPYSCDSAGHQSTYQPTTTEVQCRTAISWGANKRGQFGQRCTICYHRIHIGVPAGNRWEYRRSLDE